ncbi:MAG: hypothetical protein RIG84_18360 [Roseovarius sp.]
MHSLSERLSPWGWFSGGAAARGPRLAKADHPAFEADTAERGALSALSRPERVRRAFEEIPMSAREAAAVAALLDAPGATALELSRYCGWMDTGWRTQMLLLCQRRRRYFWPGGMAAGATNGAILNALTEYNSDALSFRPRGELTAILRQAVAAA